MFRPGRENGIPAEPENLVFARRFKNASGIGMAGIFTLRRWLALPLAASRLPEAESTGVSYFRVSGVGFTAYPSALIPAYPFLSALTFSPRAVPGAWIDKEIDGG
jgi:hypothetical protein